MCIQALLMTEAIKKLSTRAANISNLAGPAPAEIILDHPRRMCRARGDDSEAGFPSVRSTTSAHFGGARAAQSGTPRLPAPTCRAGCHPKVVAIGRRHRAALGGQGAHAGAPARWAHRRAEHGNQRASKRNAIVGKVGRADSSCFRHAHHKTGALPSLTPRGGRAFYSPCPTRDPFYFRAAWQCQKSRAKKIPSIVSAATEEQALGEARRSLAGNLFTIEL